MSGAERFDTPETSRLRSKLWDAQHAVRQLTRDLAAAEQARLRELEAAHPEARFPCGRSHACRSCSPNRVVKGPGCINCRFTGFDQTPCLACHHATTEGPAA